MATILPFREFSNQINSIKPDARKALFDTCALISYSYDTNEFHDETLDLFAAMIKEKFHIYTNVTIRSEFIDFQRRIIITEALTTLSEDISGILSYQKLAKKLKSHKNKVRDKAEEGKPYVLNDSDIKNFKKLLSFSHEGLENVWLKFCQDNLNNKLKRTFDIVERVLKLKYLSLRKGEKSQEVVNEVSWENMYGISEKTGLGSSDSMILNMFESTNIPCLFTTDFDLVYAAAVSDCNKMVFCPEQIYQKYKDEFFHIL